MKYRRTDHLTREDTYVSEKPKTNTEDLAFYKEISEPVKEQAKSLLDITRGNLDYLEKKLKK